MLPARTGCTVPDEVDEDMTRPHEPEPRKIILDCDPGHDDAVALLLAHGNPNIDLLAVTTVVGNQTLEKVTRNALSVATIAGITGVPFAAGCARPLVREIEATERSASDTPVLIPA